MSNQQRLDSIGTHLSVIASQARKDHAAIVSRVESLQHNPHDHTALRAAVEALGITVAALEYLVPDEIDAEDPSKPEIVTAEGGVSDPAETPGDAQSDDDTDDETAIKEVPSDSPPEPVKRPKPRTRK